MTRFLLAIDEKSIKILHDKTPKVTDRTHLFLIKKQNFDLFVIFQFCKLSDVQEG